MNIFPNGILHLVSFALAGDVIQVVAVAGQSVKLMRMVLTVAGATTLTIKDSAGTVLTGPMSVVTGVPLVLAFDGIPWVSTAAGYGLTITSSAAVQVSGTMLYTQA